jgi:hypothetical protein
MVAQRGQEVTRGLLVRRHAPIGNGQRQ